MGARDADDVPRRIQDLDNHDAYALLGLAPDADQDAIGPAYRRTMWAAHPDRGGTARWAQLVNCAFDVLSNHREDYDAHLALHPPGRRWSGRLTGGLRSGGWSGLRSDKRSGGGTGAGPGGRSGGSSDGRSDRGFGAGPDDRVEESVDGAPRVAQVGPDGVFRFIRAGTGSGPLDDPLDDDTDDGYGVVGGSVRAARSRPARRLQLGSLGRLGPVPVLPLVAGGVVALIVAALWSSRGISSDVVAPLVRPSTTTALSVAPVPILEPPASSPTTPGRTTPVVAAQGQPVRSPAAHQCEVRADGSLWCSGGNQRGQLGDGTTIDRVGPGQVGGARAAGARVRWTSVVDSLLASCALRADGGLWCWGDNSHGQLGDGTTTAHSLPTQVRPGTAWLAVALDSHACAVRADHTLWCWGAGGRGQLGDGATTDRALPLRVGAEDTWAAVTVGPGNTCGIRQNGSLQCWGRG